ncbi:MAG TPA: protein-disulfide reductase DsbD [Rhodocyclaceae bacterium]
MLHRLFGLFALLLTFSGPLAAQEFLNPLVAFQPSVRALDDHTLEVRYQIADGYYLYRDRFAFSVAGEGTIQLDAPQFAKGKMKQDELFGLVEVYFKEAVARVTVQRAGSDGALPLSLSLVSQGCADGGICYPPQTQQVSVDLPALGSTTAAAPRGGDESGEIAALLSNASFWLVLVSFFGFGLLLSFTPCVLPMVPILSGIIVGQSGKGHPTPRRRAFMLSLVYVLGMAVTYAAAGIAAGMSGTLLAAALQNVWVLGSFALVFVVLSLSMFGFYELQLPAFLQSKLSDEANHFKGGTYYGVASMGAVSALIVGPCVAAPLAGALLYISQSGDALLGGAALFAMALGMGVPLLLVGLSAGSLVPHTGPWMEAVKRVFGVLLLATALWMVSPVIPAWLVMAGWAALLIVSAIFMHALDGLPPHSSGWQRFWKGVGVMMLLYGTALLVGTLAGNRDPLQPLGGMLVRGPSAVAGQAHETEFRRVASVAELDGVVKAAGKPVMLDFYADWCVSCKEMERFTFSDPAVRARLAKFVLLQADVTANSAEDQALLQRFGLFGPPGIIFFTAGGNEVQGLRVVGFQNAETFAGMLDRALASSAI